MHATAKFQCLVEVPLKSNLQAAGNMHRRNYAEYDRGGGKLNQEEKPAKQQSLTRLTLLRELGSVLWCIFVGTMHHLGLYKNCVPICLIRNVAFSSNLFSSFGR